MILSRLGFKKVMNLPKFRPVTGWLLVVAFVAAMATTMMVAEAAQGDPGTGVKCDPAFDAAVANALTMHVKVVDTFMSQAQTQMQNAVSASGNSCIGNIAFGNFDISFLIPDLGNLLGALLQAAVQKIIDGLTQRFCAAVNDQLKGFETSWNDAVKGINGQLNLAGQMQVWGNDVTTTIANVTDKCVVNPSSCVNVNGPSPIATPPTAVPASAPTVTVSDPAVTTTTPPGTVSDPAVTTDTTTPVARPRIPVTPPRDQPAREFSLPVRP